MRTPALFLAALLQLALAPLGFAVSPRLTFERVLPAAHDLGTAHSVAIVHAIGDHAKIDAFVDLFVDQLNHNGYVNARDARRSTGPADVYLAVKVFRCETTNHEGEGSARDVDGNRVRRKQVWMDVLCTTRIDVMSGEMKRLSTFYAKGEGTSPRVEALTDAEREIALQQAARYTAIDAAERITPRRVRESIELVEQAPAFEDAYPLIAGERLREARAIWEKALGSAPRSAALHYNLAAVCEALGDRRAAERHYNVARQLAPGEPRFTRELELFSKRALPAPPVRR